ncbi:phenylpropionate dioxygenase [Acinetobacter terrestris]|uniref:aromatic-ring-hydroxylating dioxygenase subunit beta n=1 Tax=Acinetobacter terrestris TaxID=2529843 RepID=UPI00103991A0|nr:aromatic-ring-hydroxylating dioxygenase subunit beta [Acinetobacter terrestris]TCB41734.1 phenylpropionate dioxygenase [Acinetobacter terrestris]
MDYATREQIHHFLSNEALLLDQRRFDEWFALLDDEIVYEVPLRIGMSNYKDEFPGEAYRILDKKAHIKTRIDRMATGQAWAEVPPSRTLRLIGSIMIEATEQADVVQVHSAVIMYRQRGHDEAGDVIPYRRLDTLKLTAQGIQLLKRKAILTDAVLRTPNLGVFL